MSAPPLGLAATAMATGMVGRLVGMGGGFLLVPALTIGWGLETHEAISASLAGVLATASISTVSPGTAGPRASNQLVAPWPSKPVPASAGSSAVCVKPSMSASEVVFIGASPTKVKVPV